MVTLLAQTTADPTVSILVVLVIAALLGLIPASIASRKGRSALGFYIFGMLFFLPALIVVLVLRPVTRPASRAARRSTGFGIAWLYEGPRYLLGYALEDPYYGIWDGTEPGPAVARFAYTEAGKTDAIARLHELEPGSRDLIQAPEALPAPPPPMPTG